MHIGIRANEKWIMNSSCLSLSDWFKLNLEGWFPRIQVPSVFSFTLKYLLPAWLQVSLFLFFHRFAFWLSSYFGPQNSFVASSFTKCMLPPSPSVYRHLFYIFLKKTLLLACVKYHFPHLEVTFLFVFHMLKLPNLI